jgi:hypothetical protein
MNKARLENGHIIYNCPGCKSIHCIPVDGSRGWSFTGTLENPTIAPSVLTRSGHYAPQYTKGDGCYCTYDAEHPCEPSGFTCYICHHFVRDGKIEFLSDCTHHLSGQTVEMAGEPVKEDTPESIPQTIMRASEMSAKLPKESTIGLRLQRDPDQPWIVSNNE